MNWVIVGTGRVGRALFFLAERVGADVVATWSRSVPFTESRRHEVGDLSKVRDAIPGAIVFLSVVDDAIESAAKQLRNLDQASAVFHLSGSLSSAILSPYTDRGASMHPVLSVADPRAAAVGFSSAFWSLEGVPEAVQIGRRILSEIGVTPAEISGDDKALYHGSAVMAAGHLVTLFAAAERVAKHAGLTEAEARRMLLTLSQSCLDNIRSGDLKSAFTGPVARGDSDTIDSHRDALRSRELRQELELYDVLANYVWSD